MSGSQELNIAICGATGYTGLELVKILNKRSNVNIKYLAANQSAGQNYIDIFPESGLDIICSI